MPDESAERTPLLQDDHHPHTALFSKLDSCHDHNYIHDAPPCSAHRAVKRHLTQATLPCGHGHPVHHHLQSPALLLRLQQSLDHGFRSVFHAIRSFFKAKRVEALHLSTDPTYRIVTPVLVIAILTMLSMTAISPSVLLFMNHSGFTTAHSISPYVFASALSSAVPILSNILLGSLASRFGPGHALSLAAAISALGLLIVILSHRSLVVFLLGYALYAICNSLRIIRVAVLSKVVPVHERTTVLATHALMTPIGACAGPLVWILAQTYRPSFPVLGGLVEINRFTIDYAVVLALLFAIVTISNLALADVAPDDRARRGDGGGGQGADGVLRQVTIQYESGVEEVVNLQRYRTRVFQYFCGIMFGVNMSGGMFMTAFQPVLVNEFHTSDAKLGLIFEVIAMFAIIPPLLVAVLSRRLMDREILLIGLCSKLVGMVLYLPVFGPVREWQVIVGFMLIVKASIFFSTASMSLFTKVLGDMTSSSLLGVLASMSNVGPAVAQIALANHIVRLFGSFGFGLFAIPAVVSLGLVLHPKYWRRLDPGREFTRLLMVETQRRRVG
eukprot:GFKZ01002985.1.p1 GENE.GFKZ01002985.1~~GFKZ01002985.1.p1  ORF type:complete len:589 (-),score=63.27 GFKZ01002985.1:540-2210(-)